jgi:hypothetical protein
MTPEKKSFTAFHWSRIGRVALVMALASVSCYCTRPDGETKNPAPTADETYLIDAYVRITQAREAESVSYLKSDSLFAALDSTVDTTRIANTIRALNADPDRWLVVFERIEQALRPPGASGDGEPVSEDAR